MAVNDLLGAQFKVLGKGKVSISTATTTSIDFGTPDDINLATNSAYSPGDRIVAIFDASTAGTRTPTTAYRSPVPPARVSPVADTSVTAVAVVPIEPLESGASCTTNAVVSVVPAVLASKIATIRSPGE